MAQVGEQLGYRYQITKAVDSGAFGQVVQCVDMKDPQRRTVAAKIGKNKKLEVDNAHVEIKLLKKLRDGHKNAGSDPEGRDCIVEYLDSFKFRSHVIIVFEMLHFNLYKFMKVNMKLNAEVFMPS